MVMQPNTKPAPDALPLKAVIADRVRESIVLGVYPPGGRLSDKALAQELKISRTPVREALLQLQSEGLVVVRPQSGTFVFDLSADDVRDICALRAVFERGAIPMGAARDRDKLVSTLAALVAEAGFALEANDLARCEALDTAFHEAIVAGSGNRYLIGSYRTISDKVRTLRHRLPHSRERVAHAVAQHRRIVDLIAAGRSDDAADELSAHVRNVHALLIASEAA
jgi:DNA-binding GntR family transcriptional regulator